MTGLRIGPGRQGGGVGPNSTQKTPPVLLPRPPETIRGGGSMQCRAIDKGVGYEVREKAPTYPSDFSTSALLKTTPVTPPNTGEIRHSVPPPSLTHPPITGTSIISLRGSQLYC